LDGPAARPARVRVRVAIDHPYPEDLVVELFAPDVPGLGSIHVRLRDRSAGAPDVVFGPDRPAEGPGSLDDFLLVPSATGTWRLRVEDRAPGDRGALLGVSLDVESE
ncbi:proprotein convertase P-domain-containing protein, partial [Myxococcota bacterium]|nr:proprotein convertase P-domain-containing protein [Myxococcota bacterium]